MTTTTSVSSRPCPACRATEAVLGRTINQTHLAKCPRCLLEFAVDVPSPAESAEIYDAVYQQDGIYQMHRNELDELHRTGTPHIGRYRKKVFLDRFKPAPGDKLLEVGCGIGAFLIAASRYGWQAEGIDLSEEALAISQSTHKIPVRLGRFEDLPFEPQSYKAIVSWEVLEHVISPADFLSRAEELLRPDGVFACSVPNESPKVPRGAVRGPASAPPIHLNFWSPTALRLFFELNGFEVLHLAPKRSMRSQISYRKHPLSFLLNQTGALVGIREGGNIFAVAKPA